MKNLLICLFVVSLSGLATAGTKPFNLSLTPDIAIQDSSDSIEGLALSIWGENNQKALSLGLVNGSNGDSAGLSYGILNYSDDYTGIQLGLVNYAQGDVSGLQWGAINYAEDELYGVQLGWINYTGKLRGLQVGLVNYAESTGSGLQVGVLNIIPETDQFFADLPDALAPGMVFVNWRF